MISSRAAFASLPPLSLPPPPIPHPTSPTPPRPIPRSPYVNISPRRPSPHSPVPDIPQSSPLLHDVLNESDIVGQGLLLQGQLIRSVNPSSSSSSSSSKPQAFEVVRKLGSGSYAVVYLVREILHHASLNTIPISHSNHQLAFGDDRELNVPQPPPLQYGREFAIKSLSKANLNRDALDAQLFEATVHQSLPVHPNIVTLHTALETDSFLLLLLECVPGEDLFYFLEQARDHEHPNNPDPPSHFVPAVTPPTPSLLSSLHPAQLLSSTRLRLIASMFAQMCDAVAVCHSVGVFHRDIKPENFIVTDGWVNGERRVIVKLTDFGLATTDQESTDMDCGSAPYMSYECRNNCAPTYSTRAADVWSLGIVLINMLYHHNPWSDTTAGACPAFEAFRAQPVTFFLQRFPGMTRIVAEFFATRVFCILDHPHAQRVSAAEFGRWVRALPALLAQNSPTPDPSPLSRLPPVAPSPRSRRPSSRPPSRGSTLDDSRTPSQRAAAAHEFELAEPDLPEADEDEQQVEACSRTTSTTRRRKRGARNKGRGSAHASASAPTSPADQCDHLLAASQVLAREASKTSRSSKTSSTTRGSVAQTATAPSSPVKKQSKWKGVFRMASFDSDDTALVVNPPPPVPFLPPQPPSPRSLRHPRPRAQPTAAAAATAATAATADVQPHPHQSARAANVGALVMGLYAAPTPPRARGARRSDAPWRPPSNADSPNWRSSSSASSMMSGGSAFTRFSNGSVRSVSTVATSVSAASSSWRRVGAGGDDVCGGGAGGGPGGDRKQASGLPPNVKRESPPPPPQPPSPPLYPLVHNTPSRAVISGVPWELHELPRLCHVRPQDHVFAPPPARYVKAQQVALGTISEKEREREREHGQGQGQGQGNESDDVGEGASGEGAVGAGVGAGEGNAPKKAQKSQINAALAKMLSAALKTNRGGTH